LKQVNKKGAFKKEKKMISIMDELALIMFAHTGIINIALNAFVMLMFSHIIVISIALYFSRGERIV